MILVLKGKREGEKELHRLVSLAVTNSSWGQGKEKYVYFKLAQSPVVPETQRALLGAENQVMTQMQQGKN